MSAPDAATASSLDMEELKFSIGRISHLVAAHGGDIALVSADETGRVTVRFGGLCTACPLRPITLMGVIKPRLLEVEGVTAVEAVGVRISAEVEERLAQEGGFARRG
jgi:Fe-S cluster biogenesis protein NfuA